MAREMALAGVDRSELTPPPPPEKPRTVVGKLQNLWYHYKVPILIGTALLVMVCWFGYDILTKNPADYNVVVVTETPLIRTETDALQAYIGECGEDVDGDGEVEVAIENLLPNSNVGGQGGTLADQQKLQTYLASGERVLFVFDRASYTAFCNTIDVAEDYEFFLALDTASESYDPEEHYWCWSEDVRVKPNADLASMPADMLFGVRDPDYISLSVSSKKSQTLCEQGAALITKIIETAEKEG